MTSLFHQFLAADCWQAFNLALSSLGVTAVHLGLACHLLVHQWLPLLLVLLSFSWPVGRGQLLTVFACLLCSTGSEYDEEEVDYEESDSDESWTTESAISSEAILSSMCMNGGEEKPFACPVPGCKKRYKVKERCLHSVELLGKETP